ncbi:MAG: DNA-3-methyladenine glycosylase, partial [Halobacteriales archaeon]|nr:DNA-3-methyladenine glycosylase [Halobacteriales archaeon]
MTTRDHRSTQMDADPISTLRSDPILGRLVDEHGPLTIAPAEDTFARLVRSIISQQVSTASARAIRERVFDRFEITPESIVAASREDLRDAGLSSQKAEYVQNVAEAYLEHGYSHDYFVEMSDEEVTTELTRIRGVGDWTARMFLMFCLGREDVFPVEDLGIRKGMWSLFHDEMTRGEMRERAKPWRPYRSYASLYLWR